MTLVSFAEEEYSADEFDSDENDENQIKGIVSQICDLKTLAPGEFQNLLGFLKSENSALSK